jgi:hypothetical protein
MTDRSCPCLTWAYDPNAHGPWDLTTRHHPACDGAGNNRAFAWSLPAGFVIYTVYERPKDYPEEFVIRCFRGEVPDPEPFARGRNLDEVRAQLPEGLVRLDAMPGDDPVILETWL